ncbi:MAG: two-component regulator propeller domain-containing protein [Bacteroidota bacterium]|nr:two-component regulator propeller domain-containing protein [Bacteroidota bacterium]
MRFSPRKKEFFFIHKEVNNTILISYLSIFLISILSLKAQHYVFKKFSVTEGLPHPYVYTLDQTKNGYLWIGTAEGLSRHDGKNFINYKKENGLTENFINTSFTDNQDNLWFGHYEGGITVLKSGKFKKLIDTNKLTSRINGFCESQSHSLMYVATQNNGLVGIDAKYNIITFSGCNSEYIYWSIAETEDYSLLLGTNNGLLIKNKKGKLKWLKELDGMSVIKIVSLSKNHFFILTEYDGTYILNYSNIDNVILLKLKDASGITNGKLIFASKDSEKNIWISTQDKGIVKYLIKYDSLIIIDDFNESSGLKTNFIKSFLRDKEGNLWFGTFGDGLFKQTKQIFTLYYFPELKNQNVNCFRFIGPNKVLIGFDNQLNLYNYNGQFHITKNGEILSNTKVNYIFNDNNEYLLLATNGIGILRSKISQFDFKPWLFTKSDALSNNCKHITIDSTHNIWISTENGAIEFEKKTNQFKKFGMMNGLSHNFIYSIYSDKFNMQWFATHNSGISRYAGGKFNTLPSPLPIGLNASCFIEDIEGNIWIGTNGQGVFKYRNGEIIDNFTTNHGLGSNFCYTIEIDKLQNLWLGHHNGISKLNLKTNQIKFLPNAEEMQGAEINNLASYKDPEGNIWYGTNKGMLKYDPSKDVVNTIEATTNITDVKLFFNNLDWKRLGKDSNIIQPVDSLILNHNQNHLTFYYKGICLIDPDKVKYKYKLNGWDKSWSIETDETFVTYSNLPPGQYTFEVISRNNDGIWNKTPTRYYFEITPPFWQTIWFYILASALVIFVIYIIFMLRTRRLQEQKRKLENDKAVLENEINERKIIEKKLIANEVALKDANEELNNLLWRSYHDLRGPSSTIQGLVNIALLDNDLQSNKKYLGLIMQTVLKLDSILKDFFKVRDIKSSDLQIESIQITDCVNETLELISNQITLDKFRIITDIEQNEPFFSDKSLLNLLLFHIINNALSFSDEGSKICINISQYKGKLNIVISDEGIGIPVAAQEKVFDMFYKASVRSKGNGFGLYISNKIVEILKGKIKIYSYPGQGTTVLIKLKTF